MGWSARGSSVILQNLILQNGLLVLVAPNFWNRWKKCQKKNWMFVWNVFTRLRGSNMARLTKVRLWNPQEPPLVVSFARHRTTNRFYYLWPLSPFLIALRKTGNFKPISNEQIEKLFDSGELWPTESKTSAQLQRTTSFYLSFMADEDERIKAS